VAELAAELWGWVLTHPYLALVLTIGFEGPLATVTAGSLVSAGVLVMAPAAVLAVLADVAVDSAWFGLGRLSHHERVRRLLLRVGVTPGRRAPLEGALRANLPRALVGAKVADVAAVPVLVVAGMSGVRFVRFLAWDLALTVPRAALLLALGAVLGAQLGAVLTPGAVAAATGGLVLLVLLAAAARQRRHASAPVR
jgi:membrane protein DedA with SNARE-associated domain